MSAETFIGWICFLSLIYILFLRQFILRRKKFICRRCGNCCKLRVRLSKEDIKRITKSGNKNFVEDGVWLKRVNGWCKFLEIKNGKARCTIYNYRPKICRWWPLKKYVCDVRCSIYKNKIF